MFQLGALDIALGMNLARLKGDIEAAKRAVGGGMSTIEKAAGLARAALGGIGAGIAIAELRAAIDAVAQFQAELIDLSAATGISVESLSAMRDIGTVAGVSIDGISAAAVRLGKNLAGADEESRGAAEAIRALGLDFNTFRALRADEQLVTVARAMQGFRNDTNRAAAAQLLFGREGVKLLPFLEDLARQQRLVGTVTREAAQAADDYQDNLAKLGVQFENLRAQALTPVIGELAEVTRRLAEAEGAGTKLGVALDLIGKNLSGSGVWFNNPLPGWYDSLFGDSVMKDLDKLTAGRSSALGRSSLLGTSQLPQLKLPTDAERKAAEEAAKAAAKATEEYGKLIAQIRERTAVEELENQTGTKLTDGQKQALELMVQLRDGTLKLTQARRAALGVELERQLAAEKLAAEREREAKWLQETAAENAKVIEAAQDQAQAYRDQLTETQALNATYGLTREELEALESARLRDAAATLEQRAAAMQASPVHAELAALWRDQAAALRGIAEQRDLLSQQQEMDRTDPMRGASQGVKDYLREIESAGESTRAALHRGATLLEDTFVDAFAAGKFSASSFVDFVLREFLRLQLVQPLMQSLFGGGGGLFSFLGSLFAGGGGVGMNGDAGITPISPGTGIASAGVASAKADAPVVLQQTVNIHGDVSRRQAGEMVAAATSGAVNTIAQARQRGNELG